MLCCHENPAMVTPPLPSPDYTALLDRIGTRFRAGRAAALKSINRELLLSYWEIGRYIVEFEQGGERKADYGTSLLKRLARDLTAAYGKGFSWSNIKNMRLLYVNYPKSQTLSG